MQAFPPEDYEVGKYLVKDIVTPEHISRQVTVEMSEEHLQQRATPTQMSAILTIVFRVMQRKRTFRGLCFVMQP
jgi:hypothetical protein